MPRKKKELKVLEKTQRREKIVKYLGVKTHQQIAEICNVTRDCIEKDLREIRENINLVPAERIQTAALEQFNQLKVKLNMTFDDMIQARVDWVTEKNKRGKDTHDQKREEWLSQMYVKGQMQHSFALKDTLNFMKAIGHYHPDIFVAQGNVDNSITVVFAKGMEDSKKTKKKPREVNSRKKVK